MKKIPSFKVQPFSREFFSYIVIFINLIVSIFLFNTFIMIDIDNQVDSFYQQNFELFLKNDPLQLSSKLGKWIGQSRIKCLKGYSLPKNEQFYQYQIDKCKTNFFSRKRVLQKNENESLKVEVILRSDSKVEIGMTLYLLLQSILLLAIRSISKKNLRTQLKNKHEYELKMNQEKIENLNKINLISSQVAHDIRSPLAALNMITEQLARAPENQRLIMRSAISRINDIANQLLEMSKQSNKNTTSGDSAIVMSSNIGERQLKISTQLISPIIDMIVSEKRIQFREKQGIEIEAIINNGYGLFADVDATELKRTISNLLNNSIEAMPDGKGKITIEIRGDVRKNSLIDPDQKFSPQEVFLIIQDNGKGIPEHILEKLGEIGVSHGKESSQSGTGLGVHHAKKTIESFGGKFKVQSKEGQGTTISISFPRSVAPKWFVEKLSLTHSMQIISLDDDLSIHQIWKGRFESIKISELKMQHLTFTSGVDFKEFVLNNRAHSNNLYLVDFELLNQNVTGLDLIEELGIGMQSILVTSRYEEDQIRERCNKLGVKLIPKPMAAIVPMHTISGEVESNSTLISVKLKYDMILIDDDPLIRMTWEMKAKQKGKKILIFATSATLWSQINDLDYENIFYIDVHLAQNESGIELSHELFKLGFKNLYLATGYEADNFQNITWIKGVVGKNPDV